MGAPYNSLLSKCEKAVVAYLISKFGASPPLIVPGKAEAEKTVPCIICEAPDAPEEDPPYSGNFWINLEVRSKYYAPEDQSAVDTKPASDSQTATAFDALAMSDFPTGLNAASAVAVPPVEFTCIGVIYEGDESSQSENLWVDTRRLRIYGCASVLAA